MLPDHFLFVHSPRLVSAANVAATAPGPAGVFEVLDCGANGDVQVFQKGGCVASESGSQFFPAFFPLGQWRQLFDGFVKIIAGLVGLLGPISELRANPGPCAARRIGAYCHILADQPGSAVKLGSVPNLFFSPLQKNGSRERRGFGVSCVPVPDRNGADFLHRRWYPLPGKGNCCFKGGWFLRRFCRSGLTST